MAQTYLWAPQPALKTQDRGCVCEHACNMLTLAVEHDVLRLEIPVDDALGMEMAQGQCDLSQIEAAETGQSKERQGKGRGEGKDKPPRDPPCCVFQEDAFSLKMCEELPACETSTFASVHSGPALLLTVSFF